MYSSCPVSSSVAGRRSDAGRAGGSAGAGVAAGSTAGWADMCPPRGGAWGVPRSPPTRSLGPGKSPGSVPVLPDPVGTVWPVLAGRDAERAAIAAVLDAARTGSGGTLVVRGVAGSGKSTLLADALAAASELTVLRTSGVESESPLAFAAVQRLLWPVRARIDGLPAPQRASLRAAMGEAEGEGDRY